MPQLQSYIMLKTPSKLTIRFQRYNYLSDAQNNKIQRKLNAIIRCISKSILASSDSSCLITWHITMTTAMITLSIWILNKHHNIIVEKLHHKRINTEWFHRNKQSSQFNKQCVKWKLIKSTNYIVIFYQLGVSRRFYRCF